MEDEGRGASSPKGITGIEGVADVTGTASKWAMYAWGLAACCGIAVLAVCAAGGYGPGVFWDSSAPAKPVASIGIVCLQMVLSVVMVFLARRHQVVCFVCSAACIICGGAVLGFIPVGAAKIIEIVALVLIAVGLLVSLPDALDSSEKKHRDFF